MASTAALARRIYFVNPLMVGPLRHWDAALAHAASLNFSAVLIAPPFAVSPGASIQQLGRRDALHPVLEAEGPAAEGLGRLVERCRAHGLSLLVDLVIDRIEPSDVARYACPARISDASARDPRRPPQRRGSAQLSFGDISEDNPCLSELSALLEDLVGRGVSGFRCIGGETLAAAHWRRLIDAARRAGPCQFLAWTPGTGFAERRALATAGFDAAFSSLAWWDLRADWLVDEAEVQAAFPATLAFPEAPFSRRLGHPLESAERLERRMVRALQLSAAMADGILVPMGFEFGARHTMPDRSVGTETFERLRSRPYLDLTEAVTAANVEIERRATPPFRSTRLVAGSGAPVTAILRTDANDPRLAECAEIIVVNRDLVAARRIATEAFGPAAGRFLPLATAGQPDAAVRTGAEIVVSPAEVRRLEGRAGAPVRLPDEAVPPVGEAVDWPRLTVANVTPSVSGGPFPVKRLVGEVVTVEADVVSDGHDPIAVALLWRRADEAGWREIAMRPLGNDRYTADIPLEREGRHLFTVEAWRDAFSIYRYELDKKHAAGLAVPLELEEGRLLVERAVGTADDATAAQLRAFHDRLSAADDAGRLAILQSEPLKAAMARADPRPFRVRLEPEILIDAERQGAAFASWYELFPRSQSGERSRHGTFDDVIARLPAIRDMGFDVLYFPPIHPIGRTNRKGRNNTLNPGPDDPGSPYAIGSAEGGHDAVHPELGGFDAFRRLVAAAAGHGLEIALDFAINCSPDHPWIKDHPDWFDWRPDGTIRYAENPPKKYEDIVNVDFYAPGAVPGLWLALRDVVLIWVKEGVKLFRVDNPHTKPLPFWQWLIADVRARHPDVLFLAEAFTRPKVMYALAKIGFSQSYTYFTWRNTKAELTDYLTELTTTEPKDFFRPHFFVNTPDINPDFLHDAPRSAFLIRAALATTLSGLWGMYNGFEICEGRPDRTRKEYADSEKYEIRVWDWSRPGNIIGEISRLNRIRRDNPALQTHLGIAFQKASNDRVILFRKATPRRDNVVLVAVSLDPHAPQEAMIEVPLWEWGLPDHGSVVVEDLMRGHRFTWQGKTQAVRLDPAELPFAIWRISTLENA